MTAKVIGSSWSTVDEQFISKLDVTPPWSDQEFSVTYLETGRQALRVLANFLHSKNKRFLYVPELFCESIISPFMESEIDWEIFTYALDTNLRPDFSHITFPKDQPTDQIVIIFISFFGMVFTAEEISFIKYLKTKDISIVHDQTHSIFSSQLIGEDFQIASLRKLLPIPDGAYLNSKRKLHTEIKQESQDFDVWSGIEARDSFLAGVQDIQACKNVEAEVEAYISNRSINNAPSERSSRLIHKLDYATLGRTRRENYIHLYRQITGIDISELMNEYFVPSHFVIRTSNPKNLQLELANRSIYCPQHWQESDNKKLLSTKNGTLLSIPIDHRYGLQDMSRIAEVLSEIQGFSGMSYDIVDLLL